MKAEPAPHDDPLAPVAIAQGALPRMRELERLLTRAGLRAIVVPPPEGGANA